MSLRNSAGNQHWVNRVLTDAGLILSEHSHLIIIEGFAHKLLGDLASAKSVKFLSHVDGGTLADIEHFGEELFELWVNDGSVDGKETRSNLGRECLASADEAIAIR